MLKNLMSLLRDEEGATLVEYALIVSLIGVAAIATIKNLSGKLNGTLAASAGQMIQR